VDGVDEIIDFDCTPADVVVDANGYGQLSYNTRMKTVKEIDGVTYIGTYVIRSDIMGNEIDRSDINWVRPIE
jgi:hypothetical protein